MVSPFVIPDCSVVVAVGILNISCRRCPTQHGAFSNSPWAIRLFSTKMFEIF